MKTRSKAAVSLVLRINLPAFEPRVGDISVEDAILVRLLQLQDVLIQHDKVGILANSPTIHQSNINYHDRIQSNREKPQDGYLHPYLWHPSSRPTDTLKNEIAGLNRITEKITSLVHKTYTFEEFNDIAAARGWMGEFKPYEFYEECPMVEEKRLILYVIS